MTGMNLLAVLHQLALTGKRLHHRTITNKGTNYQDILNNKEYKKYYFYQYQNLICFASA
jgi:hypothetical protein